MKHIGTAVVSLGLAACAASAPGRGTIDLRSPATRIIMIVGDGTGVGHWSATRMLAERPLAVESLPSIGLMDTRCGACNRTTDSGAAATAFATGTRTGYGMVGMAPDSTPRESLLDAAEARGLATGLVTTSHVTDATPAALGAHAATRYDREGIAAQYAAQDIEVLLGGGSRFFRQRRDGRDLVAELRARYTTVATRAEFDALDLVHTDRLLGLFADSIAFPAVELRPTLPEMARVALAILDRNPRGFFVLLESEDTDELAHGNDSLPRLVAGMRELDATVRVALDYQARHPETLILVLGDHETGELSLQVRRDGSILPRFGGTGHSAEATLLFAGGPGAQEFARWLDNDEVGRLLLARVRGARDPAAAREAPAP